MRIGGRAVRDFRFIYLERFAGIRGTRGLVSKTGSLSSRAFTDSTRTSLGGGDNLARSVFVQLKHAQTSLRPYGRDSGAHSAMFARPCGGICLSCFARIKNNKAFWPVVSRETFFIQDGCPHRFASRCHSDAPTQSCAPTQLCCQRRISQLQGQPILHVRRFFVAGSSE